MRSGARSCTRWLLLAEARHATARPRAAHECFGRGYEQRARDVKNPLPHACPGPAGRRQASRLLPNRTHKHTHKQTHTRARAHARTNAHTPLGRSGVPRLRLADISRRSSRRRTSNERAFRRRYRTTFSSHRRATRACSHACALTRVCLRTCARMSTHSHAYARARAHVLACLSLMTSKCKR